MAKTEPVVIEETSERCDKCHGTGNGPFSTHDPSSTASAPIPIPCWKCNGSGFFVSKRVTRYTGRASAPEER